MGNAWLVTAKSRAGRACRVAVGTVGSQGNHNAWLRAGRAYRVTWHMSPPPAAPAAQGAQGSSGNTAKTARSVDALGALLPAEAEGKVCAEADEPPHPVGLAEDVFVNASNASRRRKLAGNGGRGTWDKNFVKATSKH